MKDAETRLRRTNARPRLLVVPHLYADDVAVREIELARRLTEFFDVLCLRWSDAVHVEAASAPGRRWKQFQTAAGAVFARQQFSEGSDGVRVLRVPVLQPILLHRALGSRRALAWSQRFNRRILEGVIREYGITHVLLATDKFGLPAGPRVKIFYDVVDWFPEEKATAEQMQFTRSRLEAIAQRADGIFAVSEPLSEKLEKDYGLAVVPLPNGADLAALRFVDPARVAAVRRRWGLDGKFVVGYIGNHGPFTGVDFAVRAFQALRKKMPDAVLLVVGPAEHWRDLLQAQREAGVIWTGPVAPAEVAAYFQALDVGILAQEKSLGTEMAFQIKIVEYTACRKLVVSTPLRTWQKLAWPSILLTELQEEAWAAALVEARQSPWQPEWDALVESFDWRALAQKAAGVMLEPAEEHRLRK